jgi:REP element-mobilizing transposase RayT
MSAQREQINMRKHEATDGWHSRGYLPHFDGEQVTQFVTFRLADSLPQTLLNAWRSELRNEAGIDIDVTLRRRIEIYLDHGYGECYLKIPEVAEVVQRSLLFFDGDRYKLSAWAVMPNHVHALMTPGAGHDLSKILQSLKSYSANEANKILFRQGKLWQQESFDRYIRSHEHFVSVCRYIENNPVKAGLCKRPEDWPYSSAWFHKRGIASAGSADILSARSSGGA